jgi:hypothetical protein
MKEIYLKIKKNWRKISSIVVALIAAAVALGFIKPQMSREILQKLGIVKQVVESIDGALND